MDGPKWIA